MSKKYIAEAVGTFGLTFVVLGALSFAGALPVVVPVIAALTLGLFVYTIGGVSGCHINPAVTVGLWSVKKITNQDAVSYIVAQFVGAFVAIMVARWFEIVTPVDGGIFDIKVFVAEALGAFFFMFGIASVVYGKVQAQMSGLVIGGSLLLGILVAVVAGSAGILNPAVAVGLSALSAVYLLAPVVGSVAAFHAYKYVTDAQ
jgi:aquaporin Z